jgi:hypothetical protein
MKRTMEWLGLKLLVWAGWERWDAKMDEVCLVRFVEGESVMVKSGTAVKEYDLAKADREARKATP